MHTHAPIRAAFPVPAARPQAEPRQPHRGATAPLRIVVLDGFPRTEVFDIAEAPREIPVSEQHVWAAAFATFSPRVVGIFEQRALEHCLRAGAPLPSWMQNDIVAWADAGFTPSRYRDLVAALSGLEQHPSHPVHHDDVAPHQRLRAAHWAEWARLVANGADPQIEAIVVLDGLR